MSATTVIAALVFAAAPAVGQVRDWPSSQGFDVLQLDDSCVITTTYDFDGRSSVRLSLFWDGARADLFLSSLGWSNRASAPYAVQYSLGGFVYEGNARGLVSDGGYKGFVSGFDPAFLGDFARAESLYVTTGDTVVTHLNLSGSGAAIATLRRCTDHVQEANAEQARRERRWDYIAPDPFAARSSPIAETGPDGTAVEILPNVQWARTPPVEFPVQALSAGVQSGRVELECDVLANGSTGACDVLLEDPPRAGFAEAALAGVRRGRVSPRTINALPPGGRIRFALNFAVPATP